MESLENPLIEEPIQPEEGLVTLLKQYGGNTELNKYKLQYNIFDLGTYYGFCGNRMKTMMIMTFYHWSPLILMIMMALLYFYLSLFLVGRCQRWKKWEIQEIYLCHFFSWC